MITVISHMLYTFFKTLTYLSFYFISHEIQRKAVLYENDAESITQTFIFNGFRVNPTSRTQPDHNSRENKLRL